jgi:hypothetical protein
VCAVSIRRYGMRLIDADALKKAFHKRIYYFNKSSWDEANALIDNAPTVENITVFSEGADEETLENIKKELKKVLDKLKERNDG